MALNDSKFQVRLIEDTPAGKDAFDGPHQKLADAITQLIATEPGGKAIGLEGGWGSGKSTVLKLTQASLEAREDFCVVSFDAWAHEGDPLRRTFLETIVGKLQQCEWIKGQDWEDQLDEIRKRRKVTETQIIPEPTTLGLLFAISIFLVPLNIVSKFFDNVYVTILAICFSAAPLLVCVFYAAFLFCTKKNVLDRSEWHLLFTKTIDKTKTITHESPDPTSLEFERFFEDVMLDALSHSNDRNLLIVLDNIDRIEADNALSIWSTLQTFLQERNRENSDWFKKVWIIVPYDSEGIRKLWDIQDAGDSDETTQGSNLDQEKPSDSFLDKSFQIRFYVPPLVLSDWQSYLKQLSQRAFPNINNEEHHQIYRVYETFFSGKIHSPTPRELITYINQVGAIVRQWEDTYPLGHMAYYVLLQRYEKSLITTLKSSEIRKRIDSVERILGEGVLPNVAGLTFNVDARKGMELLIADDIYQAMSGMESQGLIALQQKYQDGFWPVFETVVTHRVLSADVPTIATIGQNILDSKLLDDTSREEVKIIKNTLRDAVSQIQNWELEEKDIANGIIAHCKIQKSDEFAKLIWGNLQNSFMQVDNAKLNAVTLTESTFSIINGYDELGYLKGNERLILPLSFDNWMEVANTLYDKDESTTAWRYIQPAESMIAELPELLSESVKNIATEEMFYSTICATIESRIPVEWIGVISAIKKKLNADGSTKGTEDLILLKSLNELEQKTDEATTAINELVTQGIMLHYLYVGATSSNHDLRNLCMILQLRSETCLKEPNTIGNSQEGYLEFKKLLKSKNDDIAENVVDDLRNQKILDQLFVIYEKMDFVSPLIGQCFKIVAKGNSPQDLFSAAVIIEHWRDLDKVWEEDSEIMKDLLTKLVVDYQLCEEIVDTNEFEKVDAELYQRILDLNVGVISSFISWCAKGLESLDKDQWLADIKENCENIFLAVRVAELDNKFHLTTSLSDALDEYAGLLIGGHIPVDEIIFDKWEALFNVLGKNLKSELLKNVLAKANAAEGSIDPSFFIVYGSNLTDSKVVSSHNNTVEELFTPILRERNLEGLKWLNSFVQTNPKFLNENSSNRTDINNFRTRLQDSVNRHEENEAQKYIDSLATSLGIVKQDIEPHAEPDTEPES